MVRKDVDTPYWLSSVLAVYKNYLMGLFRNTGSQVRSTESESQVRKEVGICIFSSAT